MRVYISGVMSKEPTNHKILIFEDDLDLADQWKSALQKKGMDIKHASNVDAALHYCNQIQFDAIILDVFIKDVNGNLIPKAGYTLLGYLRNTSLEKVPLWGGTVPVLAVTGSPVIMGYDILSYARSMDVQGTLRKPFSTEMLHSKLIGILDPTLDTSIDTDY